MTREVTIMNTTMGQKIIVIKGEKYIIPPKGKIKMTLETSEIQKLKENGFKVY